MLNGLTSENLETIVLSYKVEKSRYIQHSILYTILYIVSVKLWLSEVTLIIKYNCIERNFQLHVAALVS